MKKLLFALIALCMSISANAQFYDSSTVHFYIKSGQSLTNSTDILMFIFDGRSFIRYTKSLGSIKSEKLNESTYACKEYMKKNGRTGDYNSEFSTSARTTYVMNRTGDMRLVPSGPYGLGAEWVTPVIGKNYYAFSKDKKEMIFFYILNNSEDVQGKTYYQEIPFSELQPKGVNKDFLY